MTHVPADYVSPPLMFVAFELRFPLVPALQRQDAWQRLYDRLRHVVPVVLPPAGGLQIHLGPGPAPPMASEQLRLIDRARSHSIGFTPGGLLVETSLYERHGTFRALIEEAVAALVSVDMPSAIERVGIRYVNEVRVPGISAPVDWMPYIDPALHGPLTLLDGHDAKAVQGLVEFRPADAQHLVVRYGTNDVPSVDPNGPLRLRAPSSGAYFLIDLDSYWQPTTHELTEFAVETVMETCNALHWPVRKTFEAAITDRLRAELGKER